MKAQSSSWDYVEIYNNQEKSGEHKVVTFSEVGRGSKEIVFAPDSGGQEVSRVDEASRVDIV